MNWIITLIGLGIALLIAYAPTILAFLKGNIYKSQVLKYQILLTVVNVGVGLVCSIIPSVLGLGRGLFSLISGLYGLINIVLWFYVLIHAFQDKEMSLLSRFGIRF